MESHEAYIWERGEMSERRDKLIIRTWIVVMFFPFMALRLTAAVMETMRDVREGWRCGL